MSEQAEKFYSEWYTNEDAEQKEQPKREFIVTLDLANADIEGSIPIANTEQVVRCRDCKHYEKHGSFVMCMLPDGDGGYACWIVEPDGFCKWGERSEA